MSLLRASLVAIALGGCTYITPEDYAAKIACLDEDGDLAVAKDTCETLGADAEPDCDETRNDRFPLNTEVAYDGIDQDCEDGDLIDVDGDLFPGILETDWENDHDGISYPTNFNCDGICDDVATEWDCDDNIVLGDPRRGVNQFPGSLAEVPYDGVDTDCGGDDDWDFDKDNHVPPDSVHDGAPYTGSLPQDDCDDTRADVYPGAQQGTDSNHPLFRDPDVFYDGIDNDCDGANDFDKDGDDYIEDSRVNAYLAFLALYEYADMRAPCTGNCNDCDDNPDNDGGQVKPAGQINPGATEDYYDALDQNCDGLDDFDQDLDGYSCDGSVDLDCTGHAGDDCDDALDTINPAALEVLGDSTDQDCSGNNNAPRFSFGGLLWIQPSAPDIARTDEHFVIAAAADAFAADDSGPVAEGIAIAEADANGSGTIDVMIPFEPVVGDVRPIGRAIALIGGTNTFSNAVSSYYATPSKRTSLRVRKYAWLASSGVYGEVLPTTESTAEINPGNTLPDPDPYLDFDVQVSSNGEIWGGGCSAKTVHFTIAINDPPYGAYMSSIPATGSPIAGGGSVCWIEVTSATAGILHVYDGATYRKFTLADPGTMPTIVEATATHATSAVAPVDARHRGQYVVFATAAAVGPVVVWDIGSAASGTNPTNDILQGNTVYSADIAKVGSTFYLAAIVADTGADGQDDIKFCSATTLSGLTANCVTIPYEDANGGEPTEIALYAESGLVLMAVSAISTGDEDALGWAFLGVPAP